MAQQWPRADAQLDPAALPKVDLDPRLVPGLSGAADLAPGMGVMTSELAAQFDEVYRNARGECTRMPWDCGRCNSLMVDWLNRSAPRLVRPGCRTCVVGCGLGDDVAELAERGYDVLGFDIAPTAIRWAAQRYPALADRFVVADLLAPPSRFVHRFDLVIEAFTLQSLEPALRPAAARSLRSMVSPRGVALVLSRARDAMTALDQWLGPPWPLTEQELVDTMVAAGFAPPTDDAAPAAPDSAAIASAAVCDAAGEPQRVLRAAFAVA